MDCQLRMGEHDSLELHVEGRVWAAMSMERAPFAPDIEVPFPYTLSRFARLNYQVGYWSLKSPLSNFMLQIREEMLLKLIQEMRRDVTSVDEPLARLFGVMLANANLLNTQDEIYKAWPVADMTYLRAEQTFLRPYIALPPFKPPMSDDLVALPDIPSDQWMEKPLSETVANRRTLYQYSEAPITIEQLSEFLLRTLKAHAYLNGQDYDSTVRGYASAGAAYELEAYLFVEQCTGLTTGFYHYDPDQHRLERLPLKDGLREAWIKSAIRTTNRQLKSVQILIFFTARIGRIHWKIRPLSLTYTNLGVVFQSLYLTATAMTLAPCALGGWSSLWFSQQTNIPLPEEALVGQFLLGSASSANSNEP